VGSMTYKQLRDFIDGLTEEQQSTSVTVYDRGEREFYMVDGVLINPVDDVLDEGHPYIVFSVDNPIN
jgi:hypothetical protein